MRNIERDYNLNLDILIPFFIIDKEKIKEREWFKNQEKKYEGVVKECYKSLSIISEDKEQVVRWENENWKCNLFDKFDKEISFVLEKRENSEWPEVEFILKIYFSEWNINHDSFEDQIKHLLKLYFKEKIITSLKDKIRFKIRFHGKNEQGKPDILISLLSEENKEISKEDKLALEITEVDTSPLSIKESSGSTHRRLDNEIEKRDFDKVRESKNILEDTNINSCFSNLIMNMGNILIKKNDKNYDCGKTVIWVILLGYCYVEIRNLKTREANHLTHKSREIDEIFFSQFLLKKIKKMAEEFQINKQRFKFDHLIVKFSESTQKKESPYNGKFYNFNPFVKETLHIPIISGEIRVEEQLEDIEKKYKNELENLRISSIRYAIHPWNKKNNWTKG